MNPILQVKASELRPGRGWYVVAALVAVSGIAAGVVAGVLGVVSVFGSLPELQATFRPAETTVITMNAGTDQVLYATQPGVEADCSATGESGGTVEFVPVRGSFSFRNNGPTWYAVAKLQADEDGRYRISCDASSDDDVTYAVGDAPDIRGIFGRALGTMGAVVGLAGIGVLVGGLIALIVGARRSAHKNRLQQERRQHHSGRPMGP